MGLDKTKKEEALKKLKGSYRIILSYGEDDGLVPVGQFVVSDIKEDGRIVLTQTDDPNVQISLPANIFISEEFIKMAADNAYTLATATDFHVTVESIIKKASNMIISDETLKKLLKAKTKLLKDSDGEYLANGEEMLSDGYSYCAIDMGRYLERVREITTKEENDRDR